LRRLRQKISIIYCTVICNYPSAVQEQPFTVGLFISPQPVGGPPKKNSGALGTCPAFPLVNTALLLWYLVVSCSRSCGRLRFSGEPLGGAKREGWRMFCCGFFFLFFNDFSRPNYLNVYQTDLRQICTVGRSVSVDERPEVSLFSIRQGTLPWQQIFCANFRPSPHKCGSRDMTRRSAIAAQGAGKQTT